MGQREIAEIVAKEQRVERLIKAVLHTDCLSADQKDLAQLVYIILLTYDEDKIVELWENDEMNFFLVHCIELQYYGRRTPYYNDIRRFRLQTKELTDRETELPDE